MASTGKQRALPIEANFLRGDTIVPLGSLALVDLHASIESFKIGFALNISIARSWGTRSLASEISIVAN
jgi:hypothetical protein